MKNHDKDKKKYKKISEVARELNLLDNKTGRLQTHTIRYWETQFKQIKPTIMAGRHRYYSYKDIKMLRDVIGSEMKIFCPGIRINNQTHDQKRVVSYAEFLEKSDKNCFAVIGRPIYDGDPKKNIKKILNTIN